MISPIKVVIADDHEIARSAIDGVLQEVERSSDNKYRVCATATNGVEAIAQVKAHKPDLLFLDVSMPVANGVEVLHDIRRWSPGSKVVVFTGVTSAGLIANIIEAGVDGLFSKGGATQLICDKLPLIVQGARFIAPEFLDIIARGENLAKITSRERQVLNMVVAGKTNKEIAQLLNISPKTVDKHRTSLMAKLGVHSVAQLMARSLKDGLIDPI